MNDILFLVIILPLATYFVGSEAQKKENKSKKYGNIINILVTIVAGIIIAFVGEAIYVNHNYLSYLMYLFILVTIATWLTNKESLSDMWGVLAITKALQVMLTLQVIASIAAALCYRELIALSFAGFVSIGLLTILALIPIKKYLTFSKTKNALIALVVVMFLSNAIYTMHYVKVVKKEYENVCKSIKVYEDNQVETKRLTVLEPVINNDGIKYITITADEMKYEIPEELIKDKGIKDGDKFKCYYTEIGVDISDFKNNKFLNFKNNDMYKLTTIVERTDFLEKEYKKYMVESHNYQDKKTVENQYKEAIESIKSWGLKNIFLKDNLPKSVNTLFANEIKNASSISFINNMQKF